MKKRIFAALLTVVLLAAIVPLAGASGSVWFVAINDRIPQTMSADTEPFYVSGRLYIPQSAFNVYPFNVVPSYSESKKMLVLFDKNRRLVYDLEKGTCTDKDDNVSKVEVIYRNGELFIPAKGVEYFGIKVKLLENSDGYYVLRFYDGSQVYEDDEFLERAQQLIEHQAGSSGDGSAASEGEDPLLLEETDEPPEEEPGGMTYPVFFGAAVSEDTLAALEELGLHGAFFLTAEQITEAPGLVREIYAAGNTVAVTASTGETDVQKALDEANEALDGALFCKTLFAALPAGVKEQPVGYHLLDLSVEQADSEVPVLTVLSDSAAGDTIRRLAAENVSLLQLRISTPIS